MCKVEVSGSVQNFTARNMTSNGDTYIWLPTSIFGAFTNNPISDSQIQTTRLLQAKYGYLALLIAWSIYQPPIPLNLKMLLAILYRGELGVLESDFRLEALTRSFFDQGASGACGADYTCSSYDAIVNFLTASSFWFNRTQTVNSTGDTIAFGEYARVRIDGASNGKGLLNEAHIATLQQDFDQNRGPFAIDAHVASIFSEHTEWLKDPGQSANLPSRWGNFQQDSALTSQLQGKVTAEEIRNTLEQYLRASRPSIIVYEVSFESFGTCTSVFVVVNSLGVPNLATC